MGILLHSPVQTAHWNKFALCIPPPSRAIFYDCNLLSRLYCDAQRSVKDEENVKANSKRTRHCRWPASLSAYDKGSIFAMEDQHYFGVGGGWLVARQPKTNLLDIPYRDQMNWTVSPASIDMRLGYFR